MRIPDTAPRTNDPELLDFMDYVQLILNSGRYEARTVDGIPTWTANEGEFVFYASGTDQRLFLYNNSQWNQISFSENTGQALIGIGSGNSLIAGNDTDGFWVGNAVFGSAPFRVDINGNLTATSATLTGSITATSGTIGGWDIATSTISSASNNIILDDGDEEITVGAVGDTHIQIDGANAHIRSSDYSSGALGSGWNIDNSIAEFNNIRARGKFVTTVFEKDTVSSIGGNLLVSDSDLLDADMTAADASTMTIVGDTTFAVGDILRIKDGVDDEWFEITNVASAPEYTVTRDKAGDYAADSNPIWKKGTAVINYRQSGDGLIYMTASDTNAPYINVITHAGAPWTTTTTRVRLGNLNGFLGYGTDLYGIAIGEADKYLKYDPTNGLQVKGEITATSGDFTGTVNVGTAGKVYIDGANEVIKVYDASNNLRVELGKLS